MSQKVFRKLRSSVGALLFGALAVGGVSFGYLAATSSDSPVLASQVDAQQAPADNATAALLARVDSFAR